MKIFGMELRHGSLAPWSDVRFQRGRLGFNSCFQHESFRRSNHTNDINWHAISYPTRRSRISAGTGWPGISIL